MRVKKEHVNEWLDNPRRILIGGVVVGVGGFLLYKLGKKILDGIQHRGTEDQADDNPEVRQALALRSAMNPSGISWMKSMDTTKTDVLLETAGQIKKLDEVSAAYRKLYDDDLLMDVQNELSANDYQKFLTLVSSNPGKTGGAAPQAFTKKNQLVVAKVDVLLRSSPDASYHGALYEIGQNKNIIRKAKAGEFLGYATGKQSFDSKNNVKFIETAYLIKRDNLPASLKPYAGKQYAYWVSSSTNYIDQFAYFKEMFDSYPATQADVAYKKPLSFYSGVSGLKPSPVITRRRAQVLDSKMQPIITVQPGTLLGMYLLSLNTGSTNYIQFMTIDNTERWVLGDNVVVKG